MLEEFKNLNSNRAIVRINTPNNFPFISDKAMLEFCAEIIENYNSNCAKF